ncbi:MAG: hypothetical protein ACOCRK_05520 [bacterium]
MESGGKMFSWLKNKLGIGYHNEIERKWLLKKNKYNYIDIPYVFIAQKYFLISKLKEKRIRKSVYYNSNEEKQKEKYTIDTKKGIGLIRKEKSREIKQSKFKRKFQQINGIPIKKKVYYLDYAKKYDLNYSLNLEIHRFIGKSSYFIEDLVEIEFEDKFDSEVVCRAIKEKGLFSSFLGEEVTNDSYYKNKYLYKRMNKGANKYENKRDSRKI